MQAPQRGARSEAEPNEERVAADTRGRVPQGRLGVGGQPHEVEGLDARDAADSAD